LRSALQLAGIRPNQIAGILLEPTAIVIALAAASDRILLVVNHPVYILVCDIGGGTSDFTVCRAKKIKTILTEFSLKVDVLAIGGDEFLGVVDVRTAMAAAYLDGLDAYQATQDEVEKRQLFSIATAAAEDLLRRLCSDPDSKEEVTVQVASLPAMTFSWPAINAMAPCGDWQQKIRECIRNVMAAALAKDSACKIDYTVTAGGGSLASPLRNGILSALEDLPQHEIILLGPTDACIQVGGCAVWVIQSP
jgi:molecular chaperone DnaK (HSP70)